MKPLVVIPARGGSKGLPGKNIKPLCGKPLILYSVEAAQEVFPDEVICVSTDSPETKAVVEQAGLKVPFLRPDALATDTAGSREVLLHAAEFYREHRGYTADTIVLLQPTSPLRKGYQIQEALQLYRSELDMVVSIKETDANPYYVLFEENGEGFLRKSKEAQFTRRQECPTVYQLNGAIYIINRVSLEKKKISDFTRVKKYVMDKLSSVDIDDMIDFELAELLVKNRL